MNLEDGLLVYVLAFLAPGFILTWTINMFVPLRERHYRLMLLQFVVLSVLHYALWFVPITLLETWFVPLPNWHPILLILGWFLVAFVSPLIIGLFVGRSAQCGWLRRKIVDWGLWSDTSPDWQRLLEGFGDRPVWIQVTMKNKTTVAGLYGSASFAPAASRPSSLYLQEVWRIQENEQWRRVKNTAGIMISASEIESVELLYDTRQEDVKNG